jgi:hypothetical protein
MLKKHLATLVLATAGVWAGQSAQGAFQLLQFAPTPLSPSIPEFSWTGPGGNFVDAAGSHGNGDGALAAQTAPGLEVDTPLTVLSPAGSGGVVNPDNSTTFSDVTLVLSSSTNSLTYKDAGAEVSTVLNEAFQSLSDGSFIMTATDGTTVLLTGSISENSISIPLSSSSSGFEGGVVTYTGGLIFNAMQAAGFGTSGDTSISMTTVDGSDIGVNFNPAEASGILGEAPATVSPFDANATGVFDVTPEPASLGLVVMAAILGGRRRKV